MPEWFKRNRWALLALPVVMLLAVAGNSSRLVPYWWNVGLHDATSGNQGSWVKFHEGFSDAVGKTSRTLKVRLDRVDRISELPQSYGDPITIPEGIVGWQVDLAWQAEPDQVVWACKLAIRGEDGERYEFASTVGDLRQQETGACTTNDHPGPKDAYLKGMKREVAPGEERAPSWETHPVVFLPEGVAPGAVLIWWQKPQYLKLSVRR